MSRSRYGLTQPDKWPSNAAPTDPTPVTHLRPLVGTHEITRDSAQGFIEQFGRVKETAATVLSNNLGQTPGGKRPSAPAAVRLVKVGARGADRLLLRDTHEEETAESALREAKRVADQTEQTADGQAHRLPVSLVHPTSGQPYPTSQAASGAAFDEIVKDTIVKSRELVLKGFPLLQRLGVQVVTSTAIVVVESELARHTKNGRANVSICELYGRLLNGLHTACGKCDTIVFTATNMNGLPVELQFLEPAWGDDDNAVLEEQIGRGEGGTVDTNHLSVTKLATLAQGFLSWLNSKLDGESWAVTVADAKLCATVQIFLDSCGAAVSRLPASPPSTKACSCIAAVGWVAQQARECLIVCEDPVMCARAGLARVTSAGPQPPLAIYRQTAGTFTDVNGLVGALNTTDRPNRACSIFCALIWAGSRLAGQSGNRPPQQVLKHFVLLPNALAENTLAEIVPRTEQDVFGVRDGVICASVEEMERVLILSALVRVRKTRYQGKVPDPFQYPPKSKPNRSKTLAEIIEDVTIEGADGSDYEKLRHKVREAGYFLFKGLTGKPYEGRAEPYALASKQALRFFAQRLLVALLYEQGLPIADALRWADQGGYTSADGMRCLKLDESVCMPLGGSTRRSILLDCFTRAMVSSETVVVALRPNQSDINDASAWVANAAPEFLQLAAMESMKQVSGILWAGTEFDKKAQKKQQANTVGKALVLQEKRRRLDNHPS